MSQFPVPPPIISGDALYDSIMAKIEPELLTANLPKIKELTQRETVEQRTARAQRYSQAFAAYDAALKAHTKEWDSAFHRYVSQTMKILEHDLESVEETNLASLEASMHEAS